MQAAVINHFGAKNEIFITSSAILKIKFVFVLTNFDDPSTLSCFQSDPLFP